MIKKILTKILVPFIVLFAFAIPIFAQQTTINSLPVRTLDRISDYSDNDTKATYTLHPSQTVSFKNQYGDSLFEIIEGGNIAQANSLFKVNNGVDGGSAFEADANNYQVKTYTNIVPGSRFTESDGASMMYSIGDLDNSAGTTAPWSYIFQEGAITFTNSDGALWYWQMPTMDELISGSTLALSGTKLIFVPPYDTSTALSATLFMDSSLFTYQSYTYADGSDPDNLGIGATITANLINIPLPAIDGVTPQVGDIIVLSAETNSAYNGLWIVMNVGGGGSAFLLERTNNFDSPATINNAVVVIGSGSGYAGQVFAQTEEINENGVGTDDILFATPTNNNVTQSATGTQTSGYIPFWTGNAKELSKGVDYLKWTNSSRRLTVNGMLAMSSFNSGLTETENILIGKNVGNTTHTGIRNQIISQTVLGITTATRNSGNGYRVFNKLTSGNDNTSTGALSGENISDTNESTYYGGASGRYRNVAQLTALGYNALRGSATVANNTGTGLVGTGYRAGLSNESGSRNSYYGFDSGRLNVSGSDWSVYGFQAGDTATSGDNVTLFGSSSDMTSNYNRIVGLGSSTSLGADDSIALGHGATTTSQYQFVVGSNSSNIKNVIFGNGVTNTAPVEAIITGTSQSGTNKTGVNSIFQAPLGTGNASGGGFVWTTGDAGSSGTTLNTATTKMALTNSGVLRGTALHNNSLAQGSATQQDIRSGTYTPTLTGLTNYSSGSITSAQWMRVGNVVTVSGTGTVTPTSAGFVRFGVSLPITSALTQLYQLGGSGGIAESAGIGSLMIYADETNDRAQIDLYALAGSNDFTFTFTYTVI